MYIVEVSFFKHLICKTGLLKVINPLQKREWPQFKILKDMIYTSPVRMLVSVFSVSVQT